MSEASRTPRQWPDWKARLRARLGLAPDDHAAVMAALRRDDRPLREAYARTAHHTVADLTDRLARPEDHEQLAWPGFEDYRAMVFAAQKASRSRDRRLLWEKAGPVHERAFRMAGLDFAAVITRRRDGQIYEVEFVPDDRPDSRGHVVGLD